MSSVVGPICLHALSLVFFYFACDSFRALLTGDSRTTREGVWMSYVPDLIQDLLFVLCRVGCLGVDAAFIAFQPGLPGPRPSHRSLRSRRTVPGWIGRWHRRV
jgi:hypothetical protein